MLLFNREGLRRQRRENDVVDLVAGQRAISASTNA
jgi:hypothetical protein